MRWPLAPWRRQKLAVTKDRIHGLMSVCRDIVARLKRSRRLFPAANAIIPCGQHDYSRLAAITGGGRVRIQQSKAKELFESASFTRRDDPSFHRYRRKHAALGAGRRQNVAGARGARRAVEGGGRAQSWHRRENEGRRNVRRLRRRAGRA